MSVNICNFSDMLNKDVFTEKGSYCGSVSEIMIDVNKFKVNYLKVDAGKGSAFKQEIGGKYGGIKVPFSLIMAIDDIVIMKHATPKITKDPTEDIGI